MADPRRAADRTRLDAALAAAASTVTAERTEGAKYRQIRFGEIAGTPDVAIHEYVGSTRDGRGRRTRHYGAFAEIRYVDAQGNLWTKVEHVAGPERHHEHDWMRVADPA